MVKKPSWKLTTNDRCDTGGCEAQAYVKITGVTGELFFCGHHYEIIVNNAVGYDKIMKFAFDVIDERSQLVTNSFKEENSNV